MCCFSALSPELLQLSLGNTWEAKSSFLAANNSQSSNINVGLLISLVLFNVHLEAPDINFFHVSSEASNTQLPPCNNSKMRH